VFSVLGVFSVLCFAVVACVGLDCELSVFPCFGWFWVFFFAVWTLSHNNHNCVFVRVGLKRFIVLIVLLLSFVLVLVVVYAESLIFLLGLISYYAKENYKLRSL